MILFFLCVPGTKEYNTTSKLSINLKLLILNGKHYFRNVFLEVKELYRILAILMMTSLLVLTSFGGYELSDDNGKYIKTVPIDSPLIESRDVPEFLFSFNVNNNSDLPHDSTWT